MKKKTKLMLGDNIESLRKLPDNSIDSIVTDPPYGLSFMGKKWDYDVPSVEFWKEVYRVLKPGGHILSFGGTRTYHRMVVNIEDAGFEIRDQIQWIYATGFPKSHNIGKAVDKLNGNEREVVRTKTGQGDIRGKSWDLQFNREPINIDITKGSSPYEGWGTALKPSVEPICVARKPLSEKSVAENVLKWGTGGINIDGCRIGTDEWLGGGGYNNKGTSKKDLDDATSYAMKVIEGEFIQPEGRFPANIILECCCDEVIKGEKGEIKSNTREAGNSFNNYDDKKGKVVTRIENYGDKGHIHTNPDCPCYQLDQQSGIVNQGHWPKGSTKGFGEFGGGSNSYEGVGPKDKTKSGASRFFYVAKVSKKERNLGLDLFEDKKKIHLSKKSRMKEQGTELDEPATGFERFTSITKNTHPTLKPINLMTYLCRLVTPQGGIVLDPFMGSGSTGIAALLEGFRFCGMEMDKEYFKIAEARIEAYEEYRKLLK